MSPEGDDDEAARDQNGHHLAGGHDARRPARLAGADHGRWTPRLVVAGKIMAVLIAGGFIVIALWAHFAGVRS